jgi:hypothetical protein
VEFKTVRTQETSASETNTTLKKKLGAVIAAAAVGLTGAACESNTGAVRHYSAEAGSSKGASNASSNDSGEVLYGTPCAEHEDNVLQGATLQEYNPLEEGAPYDETMWSIEQKYFRTEDNLFGFGDTVVELTPEQIDSIVAGREAIRNDLSEYYSKPIDYAVSMRVNILNDDHKMEIKDGHIVGDMCVDTYSKNDKLKSHN